MYKVFIDNSFVHFKKNEKFSTNVGLSFLPSLEPKDLDLFRNYSDTSPCTIEGNDPLEELKLFFRHFKWIEAAGGIVRNKNKYLFIYRNEVWDLPKGKIEKKETPRIAAVREIQEECGLKKVNIEISLPTTFHVYYAYGDYWIKKTHWFYCSTHESHTQPQLEEGITDIRWFSKDKLDPLKQSTFASLKAVIESIQDT
jgi:8-oxo-dGTP pyrophosphatase MutT (NUDIX family)